MATELVFNTRVDTGNSAQEVQEVNDELAETNQLTNDVKQSGEKGFNDLGNSADNAAKKIKSPQTALRDLLSEMALIDDQGSPEFQALAREAGALQDRINNANAAIRTMSSDFPALEVGVQAMTSIGAAAQAATSAQALFGSENEDVARSIQKLIAIQGLMNSVQMIANNLSDESALGLRLRALRTSALTTITQAQTVATAEATVAQRVLNLVMKANPVFLLIAAFTALAAAIAVFATSTEDARTEQELLNEAQDAALETIGEETSKLNDLTNVLKSETASRQQKREAIEELNKAYPEFLGNIDLEKATQEELNEAIAKQTELITLQAEAKALAAIRADLFKEKLELEMEAQRALTDESFRWEDAINAGTTARLKDDLARQDRLATIEEEIAATQSATTANREEEASLLGVADAQRLATQLGDSLLQGQKDNAAAVNKLAAEREANRKKAAAERKKDREKESADEVKDAERLAQLAIEREKVLQDILIENVKDANLRKLMEAEASQEMERQQIIQKFGKDTALLKELELKQAEEMQALINEIEGEALETRNKSRAAQLQAELLQLEAEGSAIFEKRQEILNLEREQDLANKELTEGEKLLIEEEFNAASQQIKDDAAAKDKERNKQVAESAEKTFRQGLSAIQNLSDTVFSIKKSNLEKGSAAEEQAARKQFKINKALQLSGAIIDGVKAISASLAQAPVAIGPAPNPAGIASLAFAAATSAANIVKIAASKFQSSGGGGGVGAPALPAIPDAPEGGDTSGGIGDIDTTLTGGQDTTTQPPMRVAVVDSDIKVALQNSERVEVTSSIG